jgi:hypothetical protein
MSTPVLPPRDELASGSPQTLDRNAADQDGSRHMRLLHLHSYFMFPFAINKAAVLDPEFWPTGCDWLSGADHWIAAVTRDTRPPLGGWSRCAYDRFDLGSPAYQDMVFFHPFVRRVFFDSRNIEDGGNSRQALMRCYAMPLDAGQPVTWHIEDARGRKASAEVTDLRLFLFANGIGILSIGAERGDVTAGEALYLNEMMRKVFPSSDRQRREGRIPRMSQLVRRSGGREEMIATETFETGDLVDFHPPLSGIVRSLLYFLDYKQKQYEQVLDERMIVYTYAAIDPATVPSDYVGSRQSDVFFSRLLYVDHNGHDYRYDPSFTGDKMQGDVYRRWAHEGTLYGFTSYSNVTATMGVCDRGDHLQAEGALIHRMFNSRYYLMALVALFYRATLLSLAERVALVSEDLYRSQEKGTISQSDMDAARQLRADFLHFSNYWYFDELANKDEEIEHFSMQCNAYRVPEIHRHIADEVEKLNAFMHEHNQVRSTEAVNRLAMLSMILGAGAVLTGYFGMNFGETFARMFFEPEGRPDIIHRISIAVVSVFSFWAVVLGFYVIAANWGDYRHIFRLRGKN